MSWFIAGANLEYNPRPREQLTWYALLSFVEQALAGKMLEAVEVKLGFLGQGSNTSTFTHFLRPDNYSLPCYATEGMQAYEAVRRCGSGAQGTVWKCLHKATGRTVAVKQLHRKSSEIQATNTHLWEVYQLSLCKQHPHVVQLIEAFQDVHGMTFLVLEHVDITLSQQMLFHPRGFPLHQIKTILWQMLQALRFIHGQQIIHNDVKPANVLLSKSGVVKLCDFGSAFMLEQLHHCLPSLPSRWYRAPELLAGATFTGPAADIWALGCVCAEIATGITPFRAPDEQSQLRQIQAYIADLQQLKLRAALAEHDCLLSSSSQKQNVAPGSCEDSSCTTTAESLSGVKAVAKAVTSNCSTCITYYSKATSSLTSADATALIAPSDPLSISLATSASHSSPSAYSHADSVQDHHQKLAACAIQNALAGCTLPSQAGERVKCCYSGHLPDLGSSVTSQQTTRLQQSLQSESAGTSSSLNPKGGRVATGVGHGCSNSRLQSLPVDLLDFMCQCLQPDPSQRFAADQLLAHPLFDDIECLLPSELQPSVTPAVANTEPIHRSGQNSCPTVQSTSCRAWRSSSPAYNTKCDTPPDCAASACALKAAAIAAGNQEQALLQQQGLRSLLAQCRESSGLCRRGTACGATTACTSNTSACCSTSSCCAWPRQPCPEPYSDLISVAQAYVSRVLISAHLPPRVNSTSVLPALSSVTTSSTYNSHQESSSNSGHKHDSTSLQTDCAPAPDCSTMPCAFSAGPGDLGHTSACSDQRSPVCRDDCKPNTVMRCASVPVVLDTGHEEGCQQEHCGRLSSQAVPSTSPRPAHALAHICSNSPFCMASGLGHEISDTAISSSGTEPAACATVSGRDLCFQAEQEIVQWPVLGSSPERSAHHGLLRLCSLPCTVSSSHDPTDGAHHRHTWGTEEVCSGLARSFTVACDDSFWDEALGA